MSDRKLVTIRTVSSVEPIAGADLIEKVRIDGWQVVSQKGNFYPGNKCLFIEIDAFLDTSDPRFAFLAPKAKEWKGRVGHRLKSIKLKSTLSQGLALPLHDFPELLDLPPDIDLAEKLNVVKWELEETGGMGRCQAVGDFPYFIRKTHQERLQNYWNEVMAHMGEYEVTEKIDGTSATFFLWEGEFGVCSHNLQVKPYKLSFFDRGKYPELNDIMGNIYPDGTRLDTTPEFNLYWQMAKRYKLNTADIDGYAIQGEIVGPSVQKNPLKLQELDMYVFDIYSIREQRYLSSKERWNMVVKLALKHVPVLEHRPFGFGSMESALAYAEGKSALNKQSDREGVVFKSLLDPNFHFKSISNKYLLKGE